MRGTLVKIIKSGLNIAPRGNNSSEWKHGKKLYFHMISGEEYETLAMPVKVKRKPKKPNRGVSPYSTPQPVHMVRSIYGVGRHHIPIPAPTADEQRAAYREHMNIITAARARQAARVQSRVYPHSSMRQTYAGRGS